MTVRGVNGNSRPALNKFGKKIDLDKIRCFNCGELGHYANRCENTETTGSEAGKRKQSEVVHSARAMRTGDLLDDDDYWNTYDQN
jgi:hypothetical protein